MKPVIVMAVVLITMKKENVISDIIVIIRTIRGRAVESIKDGEINQKQLCQKVISTNVYMTIGGKFFDIWLTPCSM